MRKALFCIAAATVGIGAVVWAQEAGTRVGGQKEHGRGGHATTLPFTVSKETTGIVSPLHADGTPDYVAAMNEKYGQGVKAEENAFVWWIVAAGPEVVPEESRAQILKMAGAENIGAKDKVKWVPYWTFLKERYPGNAGVRDWTEDVDAGMHKLWAREELPDLADYLDSISKYADGVREAYSRPQYWEPYAADAGGVAFSGAVVATAMRQRDAANDLLMRGLLRAKTGDFAGFLADVMAVKRMGHHLAAAGTLMEQLVGTALDAAADRAIGAGAGAGIFSAEQSEELAGALEKSGKMPAVWESVNVSARWGTLNFAIALAMGKVAILEEKFPGRKETAAWSTVDGQSVQWDLLLRRLNGAVDEAISANKATAEEDLQNAWKMLGSHIEEVGNAGKDLHKEQRETVDAYTERVGGAIMKAFIPQLGQAEELRRRAVMEDEMVGALVAAAGYRADKGKWPGKLGELAPGYLKEVPKDIYSEGGKGEVGFVSSENGAEVTSVGAAGANGERKVMEVGVKGDGEGKR